MPPGELPAQVLTSPICLLGSLVGVHILPANFSILLNLRHWFVQSDGTLVVPPFDNSLNGITVQRMMELLPAVGHILILPEQMMSPVAMELAILCSVFWCHC